jgi:hypothetical protein
MERVARARHRRVHFRSKRPTNGHHTIIRLGGALSSYRSSRVVYSLNGVQNVQVEGRSDIIIDLTQPGALDSLKSKPFTIKEGAKFRMKATFKVQHQILSGLKYVQVVKRMGVPSKMQEMIVRFDSFPSSSPGQI